MEQTYIKEDARQVPIAGTCDVLVCGAGPAGVSAAISAARAGADTILLELKGCLGGVWTSGLLSYVLDAGNKNGLLEEYVDKLEAMGGKIAGESVHSANPIAAFPWVKGSYSQHPEAVKLMLEDMVHVEGVRIRLHTRVVSATVDGSDITSVITESKSGREAWVAHSYVDCTGDGDLACAAGCGYDEGHPETGEMQPMSLLGIVGGIQLKDVKHAVSHLELTDGRQGDEVLLDLLRESGYEPSYGKPSLMLIRDGVFALMTNHLYGYSGTDADHVTEATMKGRRELAETVDALRRLGGGWSDIHVSATAEQVGVRESRRIHGLYTVTGDDLVRGATFDDGVCRVTFPVDVHSTAAARGTGYTDAGVKSSPYDVPLRSLISKDRPNLMMAGRNISGDFFAHASYRVTGNAVILGQAAGIASAIAAMEKIRPADISFPRFTTCMRELFRT